MEQLLEQYIYFREDAALHAGVLAVLACALALIIFIICAVTARSLEGMLKGMVLSFVIAGLWGAAGVYSLSRLADDAERRLPAERMTVERVTARPDGTERLLMDDGNVYVSKRPAGLERGDTAFVQHVKERITGIRREK